MRRNREHTILNESIRVAVRPGASFTAVTVSVTVAMFELASSVG